MKKIALATVFSVAATGAFAGGMVAEPVQPAPAPVVVEESSPSSGGFVIPLMLLAVVAAVAATD